MNASSPLDVAELLNHQTVQQALEQAWLDSDAGDPARRHEEGGWIYQDTATGAIEIRQAAGGATDSIDLGNPPMITRAVVVGTFPTHPNPASEGWELGPSPDDVFWASLSGVPWLTRAEDGTHSTGPSSRRGGLVGNPGFPD